MIVNEFIATRMGRELEKEIFADDFFQVETVLIFFQFNIGGPAREIGVVVEVFETGSTLKLERSVKAAGKGDAVVELENVGNIANRTGWTYGVVGIQIKNRSGKLSFFVEAFLWDVCDENFHGCRENERPSGYGCKRFYEVNNFPGRISSRNGD